MIFKLYCISITNQCSEQRINAGISLAATLVGTYFMNENHWTLIVVSLHDETILFMDPFCHNEMEIGQQFREQWTRFCVKWNEETKNAPFPTQYECITRQHQKQTDGRTCGIHTLALCKKYLQGSSLLEYDVQEEAAVIGAEVLANSTGMAGVCTKCGGAVEGLSGVHCKGTCRPARVFHRKCINSTNVAGFQCQICKPQTIETYCQICGRRPLDSQDRILCNAGCLSYIHPRCKPPGLVTWSCGVCQVK